MENKLSLLARVKRLCLGELMTNHKVIVYTNLVLK